MGIVGLHYIYIYILKYYRGSWYKIICAILRVSITQLWCDGGDGGGGISGGGFRRLLARLWRLSKTHSYIIILYSL